MTFLLQNMNQFGQSPIIGMYDLVPPSDVIAVQVNPASALTSLQVGDVVKLLTGGAQNGGAVLVEKCTGPTDGPIFGIIGYSERGNKHKAGDILDVLIGGGFIYCRSSAAIVRGTNVAVTASTTTTDPLVTTDVTSTHFILGQAIDEASAADQLIRVRIAPAKLP